jgi:hypothetical protein
MAASGTYLIAAKATALLLQTLYAMSARRSLRERHAYEEESTEAQSDIERSVS